VDLDATVIEDLQAFQIEENILPQAIPTPKNIVQEHSATYATSYKEGKVTQVLVNKYERSAKLRAAAIRIHGTSCQACGFSFLKTYGNHGHNYIEVHHLKPISQYQTERDVNPETDMAVLCSNCHRMIHRKANAPLTLEALRKLLNKPTSE
jgi:5-methylcytosine-specific restriction protein A